MAGLFNVTITGLERGAFGKYYEKLGSKEFQIPVARLIRVSAHISMAAIGSTFRHLFTSLEN